MTIERALKTVRAKYQWAKATPYINDPVAWALYQTWKESEEKGKKETKRNSESKSEWAQNDAYNHGLEDTWDVLLRFCNMSEDERSDCFGTVVYASLLYMYSPQEAIDKLKDYWKRKAQNTEIHLGDEIEAWDTNNWVRFIAWMEESGEVTGIDEFGGHYTYPTSNCRKTGRHFSISVTKSTPETVVMEKR